MQTTLNPSTEWDINFLINEAAYKIYRVNILATVIVLLLSAICYYFLIRAVLIHQLEKDLKVEENEIKNFIKENNKLPEPDNYKDEQEEFLPAGSENIQRVFKSVDIYNKKHEEYFTYRQLEFPATAAGKNYKLQIRKSLGETEDIIQLILEITLVMVLLLLVSLFVINRFALNKLWMPFNSTLQQVKQFNLAGRNNINPVKSNITEFTELNNAVIIMTDRVIKDYDEIKNFTENASHEIQTPLAIIKSKLELLSQYEGLKEDQMNTLQSVFEATNRLSKLNQSLILLTKIDNRQFEENESVDMGDLINKHLTNYEELIGAKLIAITKNIDGIIKVLMNETLAEILISNLITNAIKHNVDNGFIKIELIQNELKISNSGKALSADPLELFERFKKDKVTSESLGLGLSIVKKICERYNYKIQYNYFDMLHTITINF